MAKPTTLRGSKMLLKIGNGADPEVFTAPCALTTKSFNRTAAVNEFNVADCSDPDAPTWTERVKGALSAGISGSGTLAKEALTVYEAAYANRDSVNMQIVIDYAVGPRTYEGKFHLTTLNLQGDDDGLIQVEIEFQSDGEVTLAE